MWSKRVAGSNTTLWSVLFTLQDLPSLLSVLVLVDVALLPLALYRLVVLLSLSDSRSRMRSVLLVSSNFSSAVAASVGGS